MSTITIPQVVCCVIPLHMLSGVADRASGETGGHARATLEQVYALASGRAGATLIARSSDVGAGTAMPQRKRRHVYDAHREYVLPGTLVMSERKQRGADLEAVEAYDGCGATWDFYSRVFGRASIDGKGMRLDSTVHYGTHFGNALWNGRQMVYGDGDGRIFQRFTGCLEVIGHELTHGVIQDAAALGYAGQTGALNEHLADAFGMLVKLYTFGLSACESDWIIGAGLYGAEVQGDGVRSMAFPGTAYDDPILGRDPQPSHMRDYVETTDDNGGVHINSGILNRAFYLAAMAIGGKPWKVLGKVWYVVMTERLKPEADFADFTRATVDVAGELYGIGGREQRCIASAWKDVGLPVPLSR